MRTSSSSYSSDLTNGEPHEMIVDYTGRFCRCGNFVIGHQSEGYVIKSIGKCHEGIICFAQGTKFSTFDRDEDTYLYSNLASLFGFGWWFDSVNGCVFHTSFLIYIIYHFLIPLLYLIDFISIEN